MGRCGEEWAGMGRHHDDEHEEDDRREAGDVEGEGHRVDPASDHGHEDREHSGAEVVEVHARHLLRGRVGVG